MLGLCVTGAAVAPLAAAMRGGAEAAQAVLFSPWMAREAAVAACLLAGWPVLRSGVWPNVVVVGPAEGAARPAGAWFVLALAGLGACLDVSAPEARA